MTSVGGDVEKLNPRIFVGGVKLLWKTAWKFLKKNEM